MNRTCLINLIIGSVLVSLAFAAAGKTEITVENVEYQLGEDSSSTWNSIKLNEKLPTVPALTQHSALSLKFSVKDKATGKPFPVHQAFVALVHAETLQEIIFIAEQDPANAYLAEIDLKKDRDQFNGVSGVYNIRLIIGDFAVPLGINWNLMDVKLTIPKVAAPVVKKSQKITYEKLPEIHHIFREPEARPAQVVSTAFTFICLAPFALLIILWLRVGINFSSENLSIWTIPFFGGLGGIFTIYVVFWIKLNMFQTLNYLSILGVATFFFGNRLLRVISATGKEKKKTE
uniref:Dolichyl-diphosphooligosaccharide--protein glycosyltransferase subunit 2 n=1 Tax=Steinernema glaseri TaxID=37863 RepID=A0A1I7YTL0_9BILA